MVINFKTSIIVVATITAENINMKLFLKFA